MKSIFLSLFLVFIYSCQNKSNLELPASKFYNYTNDTLDQFLKLELTEFRKDSIKVSYKTDSYFKIDSNLHYFIYKKLKDDFDFGTVKYNLPLLYFDKSSKYSKMNIVRTELKKLEFSRSVLMTSKDKGIYQSNPPYYDYDNLYQHPDINYQFNNYPKPPEPDINKILQTKSTLNLKLIDFQINLSTQGIVINDFNKFLRENNKIYIIYNLTENSTYNDYLTILDFVYNNYRIVRGEDFIENNLTEEHVKRKYPIRLIKN